MLDIHFIRENRKAVERACELKKKQVSVAAILELDDKRRERVQELENLNRRRKEHAATMTGGKPSEAQLVEGRKIKDDAAIIDAEVQAIEAELHALLLNVPNVISDDTPIGKDESENKTLRSYGEPPRFDFKPKEHWELGEALDVIDIPRAVKVSGSRFNYLKGPLALMEYAIVQLAFSLLSNEKILKQVADNANLDVDLKPFVPVVPPVIVKPGTMERMGRLEPREERYHMEIDDLYLVGSAEHSLGAMYMDEIIPEESLPIRYVGFSTAFRREAGSYGKDVKGILRVHQFDKLEIESFTLPEHGLSEQNLIIALQEFMMQLLKLPYRVVAICTGDMGGPDYRQVDIETWMPGQNRYRETHTSDYMTNFQARRLNTRVRRSDGRLEYVHMNDATAFAIGRTLIAIMENYQHADGTITVPDALQPYLNGLKKIVP